VNWLKCGIGLLARAPSAGKTRLAPHLSPERLDALRVALLADTLAEVARACGESDEAVIYFTPAGSQSEFAALAPPTFARCPQADGDLGRRMHAAFEDLLGARRCGAALLVGSDVPFLTAEVLTEARDRLLSNGGIVLGPADDGGYYLIGMSQPHAALFEGIEWSTPRVLSKTLQVAERQAVKATLIRAGRDIDTIEDLRRVEADLDAVPDDVARRLRQWFRESA
jgi:rSAM/selenodomain-associated transferase 1